MYIAVSQLHTVQPTRFGSFGERTFAEMAPTTVEQFAAVSQTVLHSPVIYDVINFINTSS